MPVPSPSTPTVFAQPGIPTHSVPQPVKTMRIDVPIRGVTIAPRSSIVEFSGVLETVASETINGRHAQRRCRLLNAFLAFDQQTVSSATYQLQYYVDIQLVYGGMFVPVNSTNDPSGYSRQASLSGYNGDPVNTQLTFGVVDTYSSLGDAARVTIQIANTGSSAVEVTGVLRGFLAAGDYQ